jgi:hypothetical protein
MIYTSPSVAVMLKHRGYCVLGMWEEWVRQRMHEEFWWGNVMENFYLEGAE